MFPLGNLVLKWREEGTLIRGDLHEYHDRFSFLHNGSLDFVLLRSCIPLMRAM